MLQGGDTRTYLLAWAMYWCWGIGVTGGYHRLWSHKSYSASMPIQALLMFFASGAGEGSCYWWSRDHRMHHKFGDTQSVCLYAAYTLWTTRCISSFCMYSSPLPTGPIQYSEGILVGSHGPHVPSSG